MSALRVAFDARNLALPEGTGIATYTRALERALEGEELHAIYGLPTARDAGPPEIAFFDAFRPPRTKGRAARLASVAARSAGAVGGTIAAKEVPASGIVDRRQLAPRLPASARIHNAPGLFAVADLLFKLTGRLTEVTLDVPVDVLHTTSPLPITVAGAARVCTFHDLIPLTLPFTTLDRKGPWLRLAKRIASSYDLLFAVSEATRREVVRWLEVPESRVVTTHQAVEPFPAIDADLDDLLGSAYGLRPGGYVLSVGAIEPKKNHRRLIEAHLASGIALPLVLVGPDGWLVDAQLRSWLTSPRPPFVRIPYASREMLGALYRGARALAFPSLWEGFGLPALEAMSLGCPVIASTTGALPEVCGDAACFVDPYDVAAIAAALREIARDDALCDRLSAAGRERCAAFGMEAYRAKLMAGYTRAIERRRS